MEKNMWGGSAKFSIPPPGYFKWKSSKFSYLCITCKNGARTLAHDLDPPMSRWNTVSTERKYILAAKSITQNRGGLEEN